MDNNIQKVLGMASRVLYKITVIGKLAENWADWFNGTTIVVEHQLKETPYTILTCQVRDQAELLGILNQLNSLNLPLVQVIFVKDKRN